MLRWLLYLLGLPMVPVILVLEACVGGFKPVTILCARLLGLKARPWEGLLSPDVAVGAGWIADGSYWFAVPAGIAPGVPWATGFHAVPADYILAQNDITDPAIALIHRAVTAAQAAHPGCVIFLATREQDPHDRDPAVPARVRVIVRPAAQLPEPGGRPSAFPVRCTHRAHPAIEE